MTEAQQEIAEGLRDLHLPSPITAWPSAPGWWVAGFILLGVSLFVLWWVIKRRQQSNPRCEAVRAMNVIFSQWQSDGLNAHYMHQCHSVLRQLAISLAGRGEVSRLHGEQWVDWLDIQCDQAFPTATRFVLAHGAYQDTSSASIEQLHTAYVNWALNCRLATSCRDASGGHVFVADSFVNADGSGVSSIVSVRPNA